MIRELFVIIVCMLIQTTTLFWSIISRFISICRGTSSTRGVIKNFDNTTMDSEEFCRYSQKRDWWSGPPSFLHTLNDVRVPFFRDGILHASGALATKKSLPLEDYKIIDVGSGGGILAEAIARLGAQVTGLEPVSAGAEAAKEHASHDEEIKGRLNYVCDSIENVLPAFSGKFDAVLCSEVVEHVVDVPGFVSYCVKLAKEGGSVFFTTWNRTALSYFSGILATEYILNIIPRGSHDWNKFIKPSELSEILERLNCKIVSVKGMQYHPLSKSWSFCENPSTVYGIHAIKLSS